ncbi:hypothetical protein [Halobaculum rubrum]|uniref:hypothetical protein n=1 Tax=Halobaculum rubrum TaxID=2872158 RepID=UPI001CA398E1|nr:hypothetical protein [Halobaculum rubrum]QZY00697.1 hypothetical protein K6T25_06385 [Halobaculum rubrum]
MGDERADRGSGGVSEDASDGERPRSMVVTDLRRENRRLRERVAQQQRERERIVDHYETLLDAARADDGGEEDDTQGSVVARLFDRLRRT